MPKIVQFEDGKYGVRVWSWNHLSWGFWGMRHIWIYPDHVSEYAKYDTIEDAMQARLEYTRPKPNTRHTVVRTTRL